MIKSVQFENFRALENTVLPLDGLTLLIGPNGSGKSTALQGIGIFPGLANVHKTMPPRKFVSASLKPGGQSFVKIAIDWGDETNGCSTLVLPYTHPDILGPSRVQHEAKSNSRNYSGEAVQNELRRLASFRVYALDPKAMAAPAKLQPRMVLAPDGSGLAGVLDRLRDEAPEGFEAFNEELHRWMPEFDRVLFETPNEGMRAISLRTSAEGYVIGSDELSQGTLLALALMTLAYAPDTPDYFAIEEPERGLHPRLLRDVRDTLFRLAFPEEHGERRPAKQVIVTSHSPYLLDFFRDHPEMVVIAQKSRGNVTFERLSERPDLDELLGGVGLGDAWYSGVLGGVPLPR